MSVKSKRVRIVGTHRLTTTCNAACSDMGCEPDRFLVTGSWHCSTIEGEEKHKNNNIKQGGRREMWRR
jgi:hypothetical protein